MYRADLKYNGRETVIVKYPKHGEGCDKTIEIWEKLKNAGLPTSTFMEAGTLDGKLVVITEDLDFDDHCFISPIPSL